MTWFYCEGAEQDVAWIEASDHKHAARKYVGIGYRVIKAPGAIEGEGFDIYDEWGDNIDFIYVRTEEELAAFNERIERQRKERADAGYIVYSA